MCFVAPYVIDGYGESQSSANLTNIVSGGAYPATTTTTQSSMMTVLTQESIALIGEKLGAIMMHIFVF